MLTDYVLGVLASVFAVALFRLARVERQDSVRLWAAALGATALAAAFGGTFHGLTLILGDLARTVLWKATVYSTGLASFFLLSAAIMASVAGQFRRSLLAMAALKLAVYALWMATHDDFRYVVYDYAPTLVGVLILQLATARARGTAGARWIVSGILLLFAAAGIQRTGLALHQHFNHNDLYHIVQMAAVYLLYRGGRELRDRR